MRQFGGYRISAFGLSIAVHIVLVVIFRHGADRQDVDLPPFARPSVAVSFVKAEITGLERASSTNNPAEPNVPISSPVAQSSPSSVYKESLIALYRSNDPYYFHSRELTEKPLVLRDIPPDVGNLLPDVTPQVPVVRLFINEAGTVDKVLLERSDLPEFAELLLHDVFSKVNFRPGKIDGVAVKSQVKIEVLIEPANTAPADWNRSLMR
jgi:hypothetical protein